MMTGLTEMICQENPTCSKILSKESEAGKIWCGVGGLIQWYRAIHLVWGLSLSLSSRQPIYYQASLK